MSLPLPPVVRRDLETPAGPIALLECDPGRRDLPPVLLVPGYTGSKEDFLGVLGTIAAAGYLAVAMDQRGQFESPGPDDPAAYTVEALAVDVHLVLADLAPGRPVHLLGHSFGGLVGRAAVLADPAAFASLVLLCSGPSGIGGNRKARMEMLRPVLAGGGMPAVYAHMERLAAAEAEAGGVAVPAPIAAFLRRRFLASSAAGLQGMGEALIGEPDRVADLRTTGLPVLVAHGADDDAWAPAVQAEMATRLGARYEIVPGSAHSPAAEAPAATAGVLLDFWAAADGRR